MIFVIDRSAVQVRLSAPKTLALTLVISDVEHDGANRIKNGNRSHDLAAFRGEAQLLHESDPSILQFLHVGRVMHLGHTHPDTQ